MRKVHRWLSILFGIFILFIAGTGVASHVAELIANGGFENEAAERANRAPPPQAAASATPVIPEALAHEPAAVPPAPVRAAPSSGPAPIAAGSAAPAGFACPADMTCRPKAKPTGARAWVGWLHHVHSGSEFGPAGTVVSLLSGLALFFFAFSGLWMYVQMYRGRMVRVEAGKSVRGAKWFW